MRESHWLYGLLRRAAPSGRTIRASARAVALFGALSLGAVGLGVATTAPSGALGAAKTAGSGTGTGTTPTTTTTTTTTTLPSGGGSTTGATSGTPSIPDHDNAYWLVASDGGIFAFGGAPYYGSMGGHTLNKPIVGIAGTVTHQGYWEVASDGGIFAFGKATFYGSTGSLSLVKPIVGMTVTPKGGGYWLVASDGGVFAFGTAGYYGSMGGQPLNKPIVGMAVTPKGTGYWLVASDGGIFAFGTAKFRGSTGNIVLNKPIVGMAATASGTGYWMVASDGGIFAFGTAASRYYGSLGGIALSRPIAGMTAMYDGRGYWLTDSNGAVSNFGSATYWGSAPQQLNAPVVAIATAMGNGDPGTPSYQSGATGYDISNWQCPSQGGKLPPAPHAIGVAEVEGASFGAVNPCLATEVAWAGGGLSLYVFLTYGTAPGVPVAACAGAPSPAACTYGFNAGTDAYTKAKAAGAPATVPWWLDVEAANWTTTKAANSSVVTGAADALRSLGVSAVGYYFSLDNWNAIVGQFNPAGPLWVAWWTGPTSAQKCSTARSVAAKANDILPSGPIQLVQYSGNVHGFDGDYAC